MSDVVNPVTNAYRTYLKREPDAEGFLFWFNQYDKVASVKGESAAVAMLEQSFKDSPEYKQLHG